MIFFYIINPLSVTILSLNIHSTVIRIFCIIIFKHYYIIHSYFEIIYDTHITQLFKELRKIHVYICIKFEYIFEKIKYTIISSCIYSNICFSIRRYPHKFLKLWLFSNVPNKINCRTDTESLCSTLSFPFHSNWIPNSLPFLTN